MLRLPVPTDAVHQSSKMRTLSNCQQLDQATVEAFMPIPISPRKLLRPNSSSGWLRTMLDVVYLPDLLNIQMRHLCS